MMSSRCSSDLAARSFFWISSHFSASSSPMNAGRVGGASTISCMAISKFIRTFPSSTASPRCALVPRVGFRKGPSLQSLVTISRCFVDCSCCLYAFCDENDFPQGSQIYLTFLVGCGVAALRCSNSSIYSSFVKGGSPLALRWEFSAWRRVLKCSRWLSKLSNLSLHMIHVKGLADPDPFKIGGLKSTQASMTASSTVIFLINRRQTH